MKRYLIIVLFTTVFTQGWAQDPVFSQFYTSSLYLNPALSGLQEDIVVSSNYRSQWSTVDLPFKTFQLSAIHPIIQKGVKSKQLGGLGATIFSDEAGPNREITSYGLSFSPAYNFHLNRRGTHIIATALQFGAIQRSVNLDALHWSSQYSATTGYDAALPGEILGSERIIRPVINAGLAWRLVQQERFKPTKVFYQGFAVSNLNRPQGFSASERHPSIILFKWHGGYSHAFTNGLELAPNYLIQYQASMQVNIGGYAAYSMPAVMSPSVRELKISLGFWYRIRDSVIATAGISTFKWEAGFSFDANRSSLQRYFHGANAFELSFAYRLRINTEAERFATPLI